MVESENAHAGTNLTTSAGYPISAVIEETAAAVRSSRWAQRAPGPRGVPRMRRLSEGPKERSPARSRRWISASSLSGTTPWISEDKITGEQLERLLELQERHQ